ncbi:exosortase C-terminal domain/associated protein EpsI [Thiorhodovibrio frisius]|uniref:exosortase C-terminal domain/associated protein EpsI n=1 Tax=Thiorhodovibrio frisius TaxID=631362 RepID=UPI001CBCEC60|nr:exosortase C-terminal domain/associated protein EpsI [Thiorhodovibrio frisius]
MHVSLILLLTVLVWTFPAESVLWRGEDKQLVYFWFQQRGRVLTNEYAVKWFLFWDALTRNRTDGALVRLTTAVQPWEDWQDGDRRLREFAALAVPELGRFIPD